MKKTSIILIAILLLLILILGLVRRDDLIKTGTVMGNPTVAKQKAAEFASEEFNQSITADEIVLEDDNDGWNFHVSESSDMVAGCGSLWNFYHIDNRSYKISDISYHVDGPC